MPGADHDHDDDDDHCERRAEMRGRTSSSKPSDRDWRIREETGKYQVRGGIIVSR